MFKKFLIGTLVTVAFVVTANLALASYDFGPTTLKVGSKGQYVTTLQTLVGATPADGNFGPITKSKVVAWQKAHGLIADGLFGPVSKAKANETGTNFGAGCTNASGFSTTTGFPCSNINANTFPVGCYNASGFSITTGYLCLTGLPPTTITRGGGGGSSSSHHDTALTAIGAITGTLQVGQELTAGAVTPSGATVSYQWQIGDIAGGESYPDIDGATSSTYTILAGDVGKYLDVTATGTGNYSGSVKSAPTTVITPAIITSATATRSSPAIGDAGIDATVDVGVNYTHTSTVWSGRASATYVTGETPVVVITLAPKAGFTLYGLLASVITVTGGTVTYEAGQGVQGGGTSVVFTVTYPKLIQDIAAAGVTGFVAPVTGATPQAFGTLTAVGATYTVTGLTWSPVHNPYQGLTAYTATVTLTSDANYKFPVGNIASPTANVGTVNSIGTTAGGNASGNTLSYTVLFPATMTNVTSGQYTTVTGNNNILITLVGGTFKAGAIDTNDFIFQGDDWSAIANAATFTRASDTEVVIAGIGALAGATNNIVTVQGEAQATQADSVTAVASTLFTDVLSAVFTTTSATTTITITLSEGSFKTGTIDAADFTFGGPNATAIAANGIFNRSSDTIVIITGLSAHLSGVTNTNNTVTVLGETQTSQVITVTAVSS